MPQYFNISGTISNAYRFPNEKGLFNPDGTVAKKDLYGIPAHCICNMIAVLMGDYPIPVYGFMANEAKYDTTHYQDMTNRTFYKYTAPVNTFMCFRGQKIGESEFKPATIEVIRDKKVVTISGMITLDGKTYDLSRSVPTFDLLKHYAPTAYDEFDKLCKTAFGNYYYKDVKYAVLTECISMLRDKYVSDHSFSKLVDKVCNDYDKAFGKANKQTIFDYLVGYPVRTGVPYKTDPKKEGKTAEYVMFRHSSNCEMDAQERSWHKKVNRLEFYKLAHVTYADFNIKVTSEEYDQIRRYGGIASIFDGGMVKVNWSKSGGTWDPSIESDPEYQKPFENSTVYQKYGEKF